MSFAERLVRWNRWYDEAPPDWRFQFVVWSLLVLGAINMFLTVSIRFPFALLVVLGIACITAIRVPHALGWLKGMASADHEPARFEITGAARVIELNRRYDAMPELRRFWVYPVILTAAGAINLLLTIHYGFPFGLLFLLALLAIVAIRAPYAAGWLKAAASSPAVLDRAPPMPELEHAATAPSVVHGDPMADPVDAEAARHDVSAPEPHPAAVAEDTHEPPAHGASALNDPLPDSGTAI